MGLGTGKKRGARRGLTFKVLVVVPFCIALAIQGIMCVAVLARSEKRAAVAASHGTALPNSSRAAKT